MPTNGTLDQEEYLTDDFRINSFKVCSQGAFQPVVGVLTNDFKHVCGPPGPCCKHTQGKYPMIRATPGGELLLVCHLYSYADTLAHPLRLPDVQLSKPDMGRSLEATCSEMTSHASSGGRLPDQRATRLDPLCLCTPGREGKAKGPRSLQVCSNRLPRLSQGGLPVLLHLPLPLLLTTFQAVHPCRPELS